MSNNVLNNVKVISASTLKKELQTLTSLVEEHSKIGNKFVLNIVMHSSEKLLENKVLIVRYNAFEEDKIVALKIVEHSGKLVSTLVDTLMRLKNNENVKIHNMFELYDYAYEIPVEIRGSKVLSMCNYMDNRKYDYIFKVKGCEEKKILKIPGLCTEIQRLIEGTNHIFNGKGLPKLYCASYVTKLNHWKKANEILAYYKISNSGIELDIQKQEYAMSACDENGNLKYEHYLYNNKTEKLNNLPSEYIGYTYTDALKNVAVRLYGERFLETEMGKALENKAGSNLIDKIAYAAITKKDEFSKNCIDNLEEYFKEPLKIKLTYNDIAELAKKYKYIRETICRGVSVENYSDKIEYIVENSMQISTSGDYLSVSVLTYKYCFKNRQILVDTIKKDRRKLFNWAFNELKKRKLSVPLNFYKVSDMRLLKDGIIVLRFVLKIRSYEEEVDTLDLMDKQRQE